MTTIDCNPEEFYRFNCPKLGFSILLVPHSEKDRAKLTREAKQSNLSLDGFARDAKSWERWCLVLKVTETVRAGGYGANRQRCQTDSVPPVSQ
jgi:hypothetical protein